MEAIQLKADATGMSSAEIANIYADLADMYKERGDDAEEIT